MWGWGRLWSALTSARLLSVQRLLGALRVKGVSGLPGVWCITHTINMCKQRHTGTHKMSSVG